MPGNSGWQNLSSKTAHLDFYCYRWARAVPGTLEARWQNRTPEKRRAPTESASPTGTQDRRGQGVLFAPNTAVAGSVGVASWGTGTAGNLRCVCTGRAPSPSPSPSSPRHPSPRSRPPRPRSRQTPRRHSGTRCLPQSTGFYNVSSSSQNNVGPRQSRAPELHRSRR